MQKTKQILVIEDDTAGFNLLKKYTGLAGLPAGDIVYVQSMQQVVDMKDAIMPVIVLLDLNLPDSTGLETFLTAHKLFPQASIIVLSAAEDTEAAMQALQAGAQDYLVKGDFDEKYLLKSIQYSIERKRGQLKLEESNDRYESVFKATNDPLWDRNILTGEIYWNDKVNIFGFLQAERKNYSWWLANIHPEDIKKIISELNKCFESDLLQWTGNYRFRCMYGGYKYIFDRGYILRDKNNRPYRMIGSMQDITELKKKEEELVNNEYHLRTILETEPECIKLIDKNGRLQDMNRAGLVMIEADNLAQVKGRHVVQMVDEPYKKAFDELNKKVFEGESGTLQFEITGIKGTKKWLETHAVPFKDADGKISCLLGITRNITEEKKVEFELRQSEEKYRSLVEQAGDAIALFDAAGKILEGNTGTAKLLGYTEEEFRQLSIHDVLFEEELKSNPVRFDLLQKGISTIKQRAMKRKDGSAVQTEIRAQLLPDGRFLAVIRDLSERKKAEEGLKESYSQIRRLSEHLQNVREEERISIAREIHDVLGQQLTVMKMDISSLSKKAAGGDEILQQKFKKLLALTDETINSARKISSDMRPSLLDDLGLVSALEYHSSEFEKSSGIKTKFVSEMSDVDFPANISTVLFRIFQESLTNIARHSKAAEVNASLTSVNGKLSMVISDNGKGFHLSEVKNKKTLGLLGMRERMEMMGGEYTISSEPGKGTVVQITIPYANAV